MKLLCLLVVSLCVATLAKIAGNTDEQKKRFDWCSGNEDSPAKKNKLGPNIMNFCKESVKRWTGKEYNFDEQEKCFASCHPNFRYKCKDTKTEIVTFNDCNDETKKCEEVKYERLCSELGAGADPKCENDRCVAAKGPEAGSEGPSLEERMQKALEEDKALQQNWLRKQEKKKEQKKRFDWCVGDEKSPAKKNGLKGPALYQFCKKSTARWTGEPYEFDQHEACFVSCPPNFQFKCKDTHTQTMTFNSCDEDEKCETIHVDQVCTTVGAGGSKCVKGRCENNQWKTGQGSIPVALQQARAEQEDRILHATHRKQLAKAAKHETHQKLLRELLGEEKHRKGNQLPMKPHGYYPIDGLCSRLSKGVCGHKEDCTTSTVPMRCGGLPNRLCCVGKKKA